MLLHLQLVLFLMAVINQCRQVLESGAIITVETSRYRVRQLPISE